MNLTEDQWSGSFFELRQRSLCFETNIYFSKPVELFETNKRYVQNFWSTEMKINIKGLSHMTKMAVTLIYSKRLSKIVFYRTSWLVGRLVV